MISFIDSEIHYCLKTIVWSNAKALHDYTFQFSLQNMKRYFS